MTTVPLTLDTPLPRRLRAWAAERFPLANAVLVAVVYLAALLTGRALTTGGELWLSALDGVGFLGAWGYFLMLRVFDEHKDYLLDCSNHPDRVLQRGLVTLGHLKLAGAVAVALQLVSVAAASSAPVAVRWAIALAWSLLMLKEFFVGDWLEQHFLIYAASHLLALPLALLWFAQIGAGERALPASAAWLAGAGFALGAAFEVARKVRAPQDERLGVMTYTKRLGVGPSALAIAASLTALTAAIAGLLGALGVLSVVAACGLVVALAAALWAAAAFARRPTSGAAARVEAMSGAAVLLELVIVVAALTAGRGL